MFTEKAQLNNIFSYDLHVHSIYSYDSISFPKYILKKAKSIGLNGIAVTDHDTIKGAQKLVKANKYDGELDVIVGSEIKTDSGDIIGLFLDDDITSRNIYEVLEEINEQNGFSILPHPYKTFDIVPEDILSIVGAVELMNGRISKDLNDMSKELVQKKNLLYTGGSDAHFVSHIGSVYTSYNRDIGPLSIDNINIALKSPKVIGITVPRKSHYYTVAIGNMRKKKFNKLLQLGLKEAGNYLFR